jgi:hypothetical protein
MLDAVAILEEGEADHKAGRLDAAAEAYEKARQLFAVQSARHGEICAIMNLAQLAEEMGKRDEADRLLSEIEKQPWMAECPDLRESWLGSRLKVLGKRLPVDELKQIRTEYESLRAKLMPEVSDWHFYAKLARVHIAREEWSAAEEPCDLACKAAVELWQALPSVEDRQRFAKVAAEFQQQTCDLLKRLGKDHAAATLGELFQDKAAAARQATAEAKRRREAKYLRLGLVLTLANVLTFAAGIGAIYALLRTGNQGENLPTPSLPSFRSVVGWLTLFVVALGACLSGTTIYHGLYLLIRRFFAYRFDGPGTFTLAMGIGPWLFGGILLMIKVLML